MPIRTLEVESTEQLAERTEVLDSLNTEPEDQLATVAPEGWMMSKEAFRPRTWIKYNYIGCVAVANCNSCGI